MWRGKCKVGSHCEKAATFLVHLKTLLKQDLTRLKVSRGPAKQL